MLTKDEIKMVRKLMQNKAPHSDFDPHPVCIYFLSFISFFLSLSNNISFETQLACVIP